MKNIPLWILVIFCVVPANTRSKEGYRSARFYDTRNHHISSFQGKDVAKYHFCNNDQHRIGACLSQEECDAERGNAMGSCKLSEGVCCQVVKNTCSDSSSAHVVRFENPSFPKNETEGNACILSLKIGRDICALRMENEILEISHYKKDFCPHDIFLVIGTKKLTTSLCGNMTSTMTSFEVAPLSTITFSVVAQGILPYRFSILLTMVPCQDISPIRSPTNAGMKNKQAEKYILPPTVPTTPSPTSPKTPTTMKPVTRIGPTPDAEGRTPLPTGKININKPSTESVIALRTFENDEDEDIIEYDVPTPDSIFKQIFDSKVAELDAGRRGGVPNPESMIREDGEKCYLYDPATGLYRVNKACPVEHQNHHQNEWRIIGGKMADITEYPWQAALIYKKKFFCGGALISSTHVMTASHCVFANFKDGIDLLRVSLGDHDMSTKKDVENKLLKVKKVIWNLHYNPLTTENDIALLELSQPVSFSSGILPVSLPADLNENYEGKNVTVTGWGRSNLKSRKMSSILKEFTGPVEDIDNCVKRWKPYPTISALKEMHMCLNITYGTPCHGDSGGPLVSCNNGPHCTLVGLVSFGFPLCQNVGLPAVFTRVTSFERWLEINTAPIYYQYV